MKIKDETVYVLVYLLISILMILIPQNNEPIFNLLYWVGIETYIISGFYFLVGINRKGRFLLTGLIFGICSWIILFITSIHSAIINSGVIEFWHLINTLESFKIINPVIDINLPAYIISEILYGINVNFVINSIGLIILTIIGCVLEVFVFIKLTEEEEGEEDEDEEEEEEEEDEEEEEGEEDDNDDDRDDEEEDDDDDKGGDEEDDDNNRDDDD
ncbi:MAG: hypothetical protein ACFFDN_38905 [Candidatus Hodarchaeota archaeon]